MRIVQYMPCGIVNYMLDNSLALVTFLFSIFSFFFLGGNEKYENAFS